jgi:hypothetical protein
MRHYMTYGAILSGAGLLIACAERDRAPTGPVSVPTVAQPSTAVRIANPRAIFTYSGFATGVAGDGRTADGSGVGAAESVYEDGRCGVTSEIFAASSHDATMDPVGSKSMKNCVNTVPRKLIVNWGTPLAGASLVRADGGHFSNVRAVLDIAVGVREERLFTLLLRGGHTCERVRYDANVNYTVDGVTYEGSRVLVSHVSAGEWVAESQPNSQGKHVGFCQVGGTGGVGEFYDPGTQLGAYEMPLRVRVRQK